VLGAAMLANGYAGGWLALGPGVGLVLPLIPQIRREVAMLTPMDADSPIDFSGLSLVLAIIAFLFFSLLTSTGEVAEIPAMSTGEALTSLIINVVTFVGIAYIAVGYRNYRTGGEATARLGLHTPTMRGVAI